MQRRLKIGVIMGGPSSEHEISLLSGRNTAKVLRESGHEVTEILVTHSGNWLIGGKAVAYDPLDICSRQDIMFNAMHGEFGEDGQVQQIFDRCSVPYTGSGVSASALAMNKIISREIFRQAGLLIPRGLAFRREDFNSEEDFKKIHWMSPAPWVVKPASRGSSVGVTIAKDFTQLQSAFEYAFSLDKYVLVEEYINGREITCGILENFEGERLYPLHPIEIIPPEGVFFNYQVKYDGSTKEVPAPFFGEMLKHMKNIAVAAHVALGCRHYSRTDMILRGTKVYVLETNTLPGLTSESLFPKAVSYHKLEFKDLLNHLVNLAFGEEVKNTIRIHKT